MSRAEVDPDRPHPVVVSGRAHALPASVWPTRLREALTAAVAQYLTERSDLPAPVAQRAGELAAAGQLHGNPTFVALDRDQLRFYGEAAVEELSEAGPYLPYHRWAINEDPEAPSRHVTSTGRPDHCLVCGVVRHPLMLWARAIAAGPCPGPSKPRPQP